MNYKNQRSLRILLAEDSPDNRMLFHIYLRGTHHNFVIVNDGSEAVERVRKEEFNLILMDIQMPKMDGYAAVRAIRQWEKDESRAPMIIFTLSAHAGIEKKGKSLAAGCDNHLIKPIRKKDFLDAIRKAAQEIEAREFASLQIPFSSGQ